MSALLTATGEFLFFLILVFMFDMMSLKVKVVTFLSVGVCLGCVLPSLPTYYATDPMLFMFGLLLTIFTVAIAIYNGIG